MVYHVLNRGVGRRTLFDKDQDFLAFERVVEESLRTCTMRICAYCTLSNHWHFVLWPESDGDLPAFMQQMTNMHVKRWKEHRREIGYGHLYQGRYQCFPVETEDYFYQVVRYVERNALRANLVARAEQWLWSSLRRVGGGEIGGQFGGAREPVAQDVSTGSSSLLRLWTYPKWWIRLAAKVAPFQTATDIRRGERDDPAFPILSSWPLLRPAD